MVISFQNRSHQHRVVDSLGENMEAGKEHPRGKEKGALQRRPVGCQTAPFLMLHNICWACLGKTHRKSWLVTNGMLVSHLTGPHITLGFIQTPTTYTVNIFQGLYRNVFLRNVCHVRTGLSTA